MSKQTVNQVKKFDTITDKATKALVTATNGLNKILDELNTQVAIAEELTEEVQTKQDQLVNIDKDLGVKVREHAAELALQCRENEETLVAALLTKTGRADIQQTEVEAMHKETAALKESTQTAVDGAMAAAKRSSESAMSAVKDQMDAKHSVETAELKANISSLQGRVGYLTDQVATYKQMLDDERNARVAQAEASARAAEANRPVPAVPG